ncbi:putative gh regulated tbc protein-1 [Operophtera brumata]|uniref:Putative gh regulated tbc protein-1 n=1 Tax=Operophtera brumata TaxID=104452 RepID=A0A0L7KT84_OPEBR|nr:putative gh regulated tbc protein-1 [Operophtera brumata]
MFKRTVSRSTILKREQKWLRMLNKWEAFMSKNYKKVRERRRKEDRVPEHDPEAGAEMAAHAEQLGGIHEQELQEGVREVSQR